MMKYINHSTNIYNVDRKDNYPVSLLKFIIKIVIVSIIKIYKLNKNFMFKNIKLNYFIHSYNTTWLNERIVEIPIILSFISPFKGFLKLEMCFPTIPMLPGIF